MHKEFSSTWQGSKQPRKQRKFRAKAPLHIKKQFVSAGLAKSIRKNYVKKTIPIKKGDKVKIMRGNFAKKEGKVITVLLKIGKIEIEGIQTKKRDGSNANVRIQPSNVQIIELNLSDKKRLAKLKGEKKEVKKVASVAKEKKEMKKPEKKGVKKSAPLGVPQKSELGGKKETVKKTESTKTKAKERKK